jgi:hypothetical protein
MTPDWLRDQTIVGLQKLLVLRLPGTPPDDTIQAVAEVWIEAMDRPYVQWNQDLDARRIDRAWRELLATVTRWPAPKHLLDLLGNRDPPRALPPPPLTPEQIAHNKARLKDLIEKLYSVKSVTPGKYPKQGQSK